MIKLYMLPNHTVAPSTFTMFFEDAPNFRRFPTKTDGDLLIKTANGINQKSVEVYAFFWRVAELAV